MRPTPKAKRCALHCSECGCHFLSLRAFDLHRVGSFQDGRVCWGEDDDRLEIVREDGICDIGGGPPRIGVRLWREHPPTACVSGNFPASGVPDDLDPDLAA